MIETLVMNYLEEKMTSVPVYLEYPEENLTKFIVIEKMGSSESNQIQRATIAVRSHGKTLGEAMELNESVKDAMKDMVELDAVSRVTRNSDYNFTDAERHEYRYQALFDITYY